MPSRIRHITIDSHAPFTQAQFWAGVLGYTEDPDYPNLPDDPEALIVDPTGRQPGLLFVPVPEAKTIKNRVHLDLQPEATRDATVERLTGSGATLVADHRRPDGKGWVVLGDPEGNEFCIERSAAERAEPGAAVTDTGDRPYVDGVYTAGERHGLEAMLDWHRAGVVAKVAGISQLHAAAKLLPSGTTIAGLVKHLALVEDSWFENRFAGNPDPEPWAAAPWDDDRDWEFHSAPDEPIADSVALYEAACERSRRVSAAHELDDMAARDNGRPFNLRFVYLHMIEETARHLGHLDILREQLDGTVGE